MNDNVNHPEHYAGHYRIEVIDLAELFDFNMGNVVKYLLRAPFKHSSPVEDLKKASWYIARYLHGCHEYTGAMAQAIGRYFVQDLERQNLKLYAEVLSDLLNGNPISAQDGIKEIIKGEENNAEIRDQH